MRKEVPFQALVVLVAALWSSLALAQDFDCSSGDKLKARTCNLSGFDSRMKAECLAGSQDELGSVAPVVFAQGQEQQAKNFIEQLAAKRWCEQERATPPAPTDLSLRQNVETFKDALIDNGKVLTRYGGQCDAQLQLCMCATKDLTPKLDCKRFDAESQFNKANASYIEASKQDKNLLKTASQGAGGKKDDLGKDMMQGLNAAMPGLMMAAQMMRQQGGQDYQQPYDTSAMQVTDPCTPGADGSSVCAVMPQTAGSATAESWNKGSSAYSMGDNKSGGSFNPADMGALGGMNADGIAPADPSRGGGSGGAGIPNGGGGGIPGGGSSSPASLGAAAPANSGGGVNSNRADIMRGEGGGGGYSQQNAALSTAAGNGGGFGGYGRPNTMERLNLAEFLPGGKKDPVKRGLAGAGNATYVQIQSKEVNIWNRISERMKSRCSQGLLKDCIH